jgi:lysophospholipase L1-like esterase
MIVQRVIIAILVFSFPFLLRAQDVPFTDIDYSFIEAKKNKLLNADYAVGFDQFYSKWAKLIRTGNEKIEVLHLGDSHIQADFLTGRIRQRMQQFFPGSEGARGLIFPYNLAQTNNPGNYHIQSDNNWTVVNSVKSDDFSTGIIPAKVICGDSIIRVQIKQKDNLQYSGFDRIEIWYATNADIKIEKPVAAKVTLLDGYGRIVIGLDAIKKDVEIVVTGASDAERFELYGIGLFNDLPGITYDALGLNGATTKDFVNCEHFERFLKYTNPDLIIVSLGTNDLYDLNVRMENFTLDYGAFLQKIRRVFPNKGLILTTPGDHFIYGYLPNSKLNEASRIIKQLSKRFNAATWDFYEIMGGYRSMMGWDMHGLSAKDRIHLSRKGYHLQADLFFNAILKDFEAKYLNGNYYNTLRGVNLENSQN